MMAYQQRVVDEKSALDRKLGRLTEFMTGESFSLINIAEQIRLNRQRMAMYDYSAVLGERIAAFSKPAEASHHWEGGSANPQDL